MFGNFSERIYKEKFGKKYDQLNEIDGLVAFAAKELFESSN